MAKLHPLWIKIANRVLFVSSFLFVFGGVLNRAYAHGSGTDSNLESTYEALLFDGNDLSQNLYHAIPFIENYENLEETEEREIQKNELDGGGNAVAFVAFNIFHLDVPLSSFSTCRALVFSKETSPLYILYHSWKGLLF